MPSRLALLGMIGSPLLTLSAIGVLFDVYDAGAPVKSVAALPEIIWNPSPCFYPLIRGFKPRRLQSSRRRGAPSCILP